ncbi:hypothetical protein [uncultured Vagococcus sp.]|uniref:hypothetical protein n=1 Tax=uncultured Vagococcus sp. TaxID=189676 RepID=UPI002588BEE5|nr:hypothetical protein [uncultured Vagococcus sp.]
MFKEENCQIKFLVKFDNHKEINSRESFVNLFNSNLHNQLQIEGDKVNDEINNINICDIGIKCVNESGNTFFILSFVTSRIENLKKIKSKLKEFENKINKSRVIILKDDISLYYSSIAYQKLHVLENTIRSLITEIAMFKSAEQSIKYTVNEGKNKEINEVVYNTNFDKLQQILFSNTGSCDLKQLLDDLRTETEIDKAVTLIEESLHPSIWDKYFVKEFSSMEMRLDAKAIKKRLDELYGLRNNIAHNNEFDETKFDKFTRICVELQTNFDSAIEYFERNPEMLGITSEEIEQTVVDSISSDANRDTILVPASKVNFEKLFLNQNKWESINIGDSNIPNIKYIAAYVTKSNVGKGQYVSHYAKVDKIIPSEEHPGKYSVHFEGTPIELPDDIILGSNPNLAVQSMRYTSFEELLKAKTLQDLFS